MESSRQSGTQLARFRCCSFPHLTDPVEGDTRAAGCWWFDRRECALQVATEGAGLAFGEDVTVCLDFGAQSFFKQNTGEVGSYAYEPEEGALIEANDWPEWIEKLLTAHPQVQSVVDACADEDFDTWLKVRQLLSGREERVLLLGRDLFREDPDKLRAGVAEGWAEGVVLAAQRVPTVTELVDDAALFTLLRPRASRVILDLRPGPSLAAPAPEPCATTLAVRAAVASNPSRS